MIDFFIFGFKLKDLFFKKRRNYLWLLFWELIFIYFDGVWLFILDYKLFMNELEDLYDW